MPASKNAVKNRAPPATLFADPLDCEQRECREQKRIADALYHSSPQRHRQ